ncbi:N-acetylglucosamine repressor [Paraliobacillus ryukyuensis]|uniref:MarR family transcriptional regulator n=1 Tax=Paraliobacillus ryukyuensis TaxID=200904 RepID=A0A366EDP0_9BACI|nr:ROK family transcriptional regulator [Paraliobacillus ryukyuensis]RBP00433.1 MarR family transcriptional regulator [Paraliobacillus ryukyuensis]
MQTGSFQWMKSLNKTIIMNKILNDGPISRAQIAKETNLTPPTVGSIVKELMEQGIIIESTQGASQGGRRPTMLEIHYQNFYIIGVDAGSKEIEAILTDLSGQIIEQNRIELEQTNTNEGFINKLVSSIQGVIQPHHQQQDKIIGIGVAMHGVVDVITGSSVYAPNLNLYDIPIQATLEDFFQVDVKVENDVRSMALGEVWFGQGKNTPSMVAVNLGNGVGAGWTINGQRYHGATSIAGELGHMTIDVHGKACTCGNQGCLQTIVSGPAIGARAQEQLPNIEHSVLQAKANSISGQDVYQAALEGDNFAIKLLHETGEYIGIGLTNLIHLINPSKIILGGGVSRASEFILEPIKDTISKRALTNQAKQTEIVVSNLGEQATALGAIALILAQVFEQKGEVAN